MRRAFCFWLGSLLLALPLSAAGPGDAVVVVYNRRMSESKSVAEYYAAHRQVPAAQVVGLELPTTETMTRVEYRLQLLEPLIQSLEQNSLLTFTNEPVLPANHKPVPFPWRVNAAKIRYAVLCYGVPVRILRSTNLVEQGESAVRPEFRRNEAAVDNELALLPVSKNVYPLFGPLGNPLYNSTNPAALSPTNGLLMVCRLDGPSPAIARGLVDKALEAEADGLWGRAYFDARGITNGTYKPGDEMILSAAAVCRRLGFETVIDDKPETFSAAFPLSQVAIYAGWYDANVSGPFTRPKVEFMPGAFAYHLHSFSAHVLRTPHQYWVGPLLAKGATATMGCVDEPYLSLTPNIAAFCARFLAGYTFGEAAYASLDVLSWQTTVIGDPLYRPFSRLPVDQHAELLRRKSKLIEWSLLRAVNLNQVLGVPVARLIAYLEGLTETRHSAVLEEKLGELYQGQGQLPEAIDAFSAALGLAPSPQQRVRLTLQLTQWLVEDHREAAAYELLQKFLKQFPDYPDPAAIYHRLLTLARSLGKPADVQHYQNLLDRLAAAAANG